MNTETIQKQIASISDDIQRLTGVLYTLGGIDIPRYYNEYEKVSVELAQRAEWIALCLLYPCSEARLYAQSAGCLGY